MGPEGRFKQSALFVYLHNLTFHNFLSQTLQIVLFLVITLQNGTLYTVSIDYIYLYLSTYVPHRHRQTDTHRDTYTVYMYKIIHSGSKYRHKEF